MCFLTGYRKCEEVTFIKRKGTTEMERIGELFYENKFVPKSHEVEICKSNGRWNHHHILMPWKCSNLYQL